MIGCSYVRTLGTAEVASTWQAALVDDDSITIAALRPGDALAFSSGAAHFVTNGADGLSAAVYHGLITRATVPRLRAAAAAEAGAGSAADGAGGRYARHMHASDTWREVRRVMRERDSEAGVGDSGG